MRELNSWGKFAGFLDQANWEGWGKLNSSRIDSIQQMLVDEPDDLFLRYALAME